MTDLNTKTWLRLAFLAVAMALQLFLPAGTLRYWQAWLYLLVFFGASASITRWLMQNDPALLRRRSKGGARAEKEASQKIIMVFTSIGFGALLIGSGLDHRFGWSHIPAAIVIAGDILMALGLYLIFRVFKENSFASATIELAPEQRVIATGAYARVRHPMYAGGLVYLLATPLALSSWWALLAVVAIAPFLAWRMLDEERFLARHLPGYAEYRAKVRWRLIPGVF
jgi:protein-S-isoprenylcysteine O-methyltransferase Ste14